MKDDTPSVYCYDRRADGTRAEAVAVLRFRGRELIRQVVTSDAGAREFYEDCQATLRRMVK